MDIKKQMFSKRYAPKKKLTHVFMDGGKLSVPKSRLSIFYKQLVKEYGDDFPPIVELVNAYGDYKFCLDIDNEDADLEMILSEVQKLFTTELECEILQRVGGEKKYHVIYNLMTNKKMTSCILSKLPHEVKDQLDLSIYNTGLRMSNTIKPTEDALSKYHKKFNKKHSILDLSECKKYELVEEYKPEEKEEKEEKKDSIIYNSQDIEYYKLLVNCLTVDRMTDYQTWIKVMFCLKNIGNDQGTDILFKNIFIECSKQVVEKFDREKISKTWDNLKVKKDGLNIGSLINWAKEDNLTEYNKIVKNKFDYTTGYGVACIFKQLYGHHFVYTTDEQKEIRWKYFNGLKWLNDFEGSYVSIYIMKKLVDEFYIPLMNQCIKNAEEEDKKKIIVSFNKIITRLRTNKSIAGIIKILQKILLDSKFVDKCDTDPNLVGFDNGVYDLQERKFRQQKYTDRVLMSTNYHFSEERDDVVKEKIETFFKQVMPKEDERDYLLTTLSTCLEGFNTEEIYPNWEGTGGNGKGTTTALVYSALGEYAGSMPVNLLTAKRADANNHNSAMYSLMKKRFIIASEPEKNAKLNDTLMKELTGQDKISVRQIYGKNKDIIPQFTLFMQCNKLPSVDDDSEGTWRRMCLVKFANSFTGKNRNENLKKEMKKWNLEFFHILLEYYFKYVDGGRKLNKPESFKIHEKQFKSSQNPVEEYCNNKIVKSDDNNDVLKAKELYDIFNNFAVEEGLTIKMKKKDFMKQFEKVLKVKFIIKQTKINGKKYRNFIRGYKFEEDDEEEEENEYSHALDMQF